VLPLPTGSISWLSLTAAVITRGRRTSPAARAFRFTTFIRRIIDALSRVRTEGRQGRAASEPPISVAIKYAPCVRTDGRTDGQRGYNGITDIAAASMQTEICPPTGPDRPLRRRCRRRRQTFYISGNLWAAWSARARFASVNISAVFRRI